MNTNSIESFEKFDRENPVVWRLFVRFANEARNHSHNKFSGYLIINRIRWETTIVSKDEDFKISNNHIPFYTRKMMAFHPEFKGFFAIKPSIADRVRWNTNGPTP